MLEHLETRLAPATFTVNNTLDDGSAGSLRWAILQANTTAGADTIAFASSVFSSTKTITLTSALPALTNSDQTTIQGPGAGLLTIDGANAYQVFSINSGASASLGGLTIAHGYAINGGGIFNQGTLAVTSSTLSGNTAYSGGGIFNEGTLTVTSSYLSSNSSRINGGGIFNETTMTVTSSTLRGNSSDDGGGGIWNLGSLAVTNCTLMNLPTNGGHTDNGVKSP